MDARAVVSVLLLVCLIPFCTADTEGATAFESPDGVSYQYGTDGSDHSTYKAWIESAASDSEVVHIASSLEGYEVKDIRAGALDLPSARIVVVPEFVKTIGEGAFSGCPVLEEILFMCDRPEIVGGLPDGVAVKALRGTEGWDASVPSMEEFDETSGDGSIIRYVVIGDSLMVVGGTPSKDGSVTIGSEVSGMKVASVGPYAFAGRDSEDGTVVVPRTDVKKATIPEGVEVLRERSFYYCGGLESIGMPSSLTTIMDESFRACSDLVDARIPSKVSYLGFESFRHCTSLPSISIPDSVRFIGEGAFKVCSAVERISVGDGLQIIADWAFAYCGVAVSVEIGNGVEQIGASVFYSCTSLGSASLPDSVRSIGRDAFYSCSSMRDLRLGSDLETIGVQAFRGCSELSSLTVPSKVVSVGDRAFAYCSSMEDIRFKGDMPVFGSSVFLNDDVVVHCTESHAESWKDYDGYVVIDEDGDGNGGGFLAIAAVIVLAAVIVCTALALHRRRSI